MVTKKIRSIRKILLAVLYLQLVSIIQRIVFDFLGYMWLVILFGITALIFVIFGLFGAHQQKARLLLTYMIWTLPWILFNVIVILAYTGTGSITHTNDWLSLKQNSISWYHKNGIGCKQIPFTQMYKDCLLRFEHVEIIQASVQILFAIIGFGLAFRLRQLVNIAKEFYVVGNLNPYASYVRSNQAASTTTDGSRTSKPFIITSSYT